MITCKNVCLLADEMSSLYKNGKVLNVYPRCLCFFIKLHIKKVVTLFLKGKGLFGQDIRCLHNKDFQELYILHAIVVESTLKTIF